MEQVYLNWGATSYRKFPETIAKCCGYLQENQTANLHRNLDYLELNPIALETRLILKDFFGVEDASHIVFTNNVTTGINMVLNGLLEPGDHVVTTSVEHNAVARPLELLKKTHHIEVTVVPCSPEGFLSMTDFYQAFKENTKLLIMNHASNVLGTITPVCECFDFAKEKGVVTILDAAQTAGYLEIDMKEMNIDVLCFTGHKSLMSLAGVGGFAMKKNIAPLIRPWLVGGTGSYSESLVQPEVLPDKFESGTENTLGILSLGSSVEKIQQIGIQTIRQQEETLTSAFLEGLASLPVKVLGSKVAHKQVPVVSVVPEKIEPAMFSQILYENYGIITRCGLHCAPWAHETAGTIKTGATRFSFGYYTTKTEIYYALQSIREILK